MSLIPYYSGVCSTPTPPYVCNPCPTTEKGRVRSVALVKPTYTFLDPTDPAEWLTAINAGHIVMIPSVRGKYDGGAEKKGEGYGGELERLMNYSYALDWKDLNFYGVKSFYDTIDKNPVWNLCFFTGLIGWLVTAACTITTKDAVTEDIESDVVWEAKAVWQSLYKPTKFLAPAGIQNCFAVV